MSSISGSPSPLPTPEARPSAVPATPAPATEPRPLLSSPMPAPDRVDRPPSEPAPTSGTQTLTSGLAQNFSSPPQDLSLDVRAHNRARVDHSRRVINDPRTTPEQRLQTQRDLADLRANPDRLGAGTGLARRSRTLGETVDGIVDLLGQSSWTRDSNCRAALGGVRESQRSGANLASALDQNFPSTVACAGELRTRQMVAAGAAIGIAAGTPWGPPGQIIGGAVGGATGYGLNRALVAIGGE
jgi:hypothetical protein